MTAPTPLQLAIAHQDHMRDTAAKIRDDAGCIGRLLIGRTVRRKGDGAMFTLTEARLGVNATVSLHGKPIGKKRTAHIGVVREIEIVEPPLGTGP